MRKAAFLIAACFVLTAAAPVMASETGPVIVIPGRQGVPVIINGRDASYAVVEGDWGLARPSQTDPNIIFYYGHQPYLLPPAAPYFPAGGPPPKLGRQEVDKPRPPGAAQNEEGYIRSWSAQSNPTPATSPTDYEMPPVVVAPDDWRRGPRRR